MTEQHKIFAIFHIIEATSKYQLEIKENDQSYFVSNNNQPQTFTSLAEAKAKAKSLHATKAYLSMRSPSGEMIDANPSKEASTIVDLIPTSLQ